MLLRQSHIFHCSFCFYPVLHDLMFLPTTVHADINTKFKVMSDFHYICCASVSELLNNPDSEKNKFPFQFQTFVTV